MISCPITSSASRSTRTSAEVMRWMPARPSTTNVFRARKPYLRTQGLLFPSSGIKQPFYSGLRFFPFCRCRIVVLGGQRRMTHHWTYLFTGILSEVAGTTGMRALVFSHPMLSQASATIGIVISYFCVSRAVEKIPMGIAYAVWSGAGTGAISLLSVFFFFRNHAAAQVTGSHLCDLGHGCHQSGQGRLRCFTTWAFPGN